MLISSFSHVCFEDVLALIFHYDNGDVAMDTYSFREDCAFERDLNTNGNIQEK